MATKPKAQPTVCAGCGRPFEGDLMGASDIAKMLGVSRQRVDQLMRGVDSSGNPSPRPDFPQYQQAGTYRLVSRAAIEAWRRTWDRRPGRKAKASA